MAGIVQFQSLSVMLNSHILSDFEDDVINDCVNSVARVISTHPEILQQAVPQSPDSSWLHLAAARGSLNVAKHLMAAGMPVDAQDRTNCTPLTHAVVSSRNVEMIKLLLGWGAHPDGADGHTGGFKYNDVRFDGPGRPCLFRSSPLIIAAIRNNVDALRTLVAAGANVLAVSFYGKQLNALESAKNSKNHEATEFLEPIFQAERAYRLANEITKTEALKDLRPI